MGPVMLGPEGLERIENMFESRIHVFQFFKQTVQMDMAAFRVDLCKEAFHICTLETHIYAWTIGEPCPFLAAIPSHIAPAPLPTSDPYGSQAGNAGNEVYPVVYDTSYAKAEVGCGILDQTLKYT